MLMDIKELLKTKVSFFLIHWLASGLMVIINQFLWGPPADKTVRRAIAADLGTQLQTWENEW
jgi:hypothetical protein